MREDGALVVLTTVADEAAADVLSRRLVEERLAACVTRAAVKSTYRWQGEVETSSEQLLVIKSAAGCWERLRARIRELHDYDVPEILAIEAARVDAAYRSWLLEAVGVGATR